MLALLRTNARPLPRHEELHLWEQLFSFFASERFSSATPFSHPSLSYPNCRGFAHFPCSISAGVFFVSFSCFLRCVHPLLSFLIQLRSFFWCAPIFLQLAMAKDLIWVSTQLTPGPGVWERSAFSLRRPSRQLLSASAPSVTTCRQNTSHGTFSRTLFTCSRAQSQLACLQKTFTPIHMSSMFDERSPIFSRFHSPSLLSFSYFLPTPTSTTSPSDNPATITRNEEHTGRLVTSKPLTGYEPKELDDIEVAHNSWIFQSSNVTSIFDMVRTARLPKNWRSTTKTWGMRSLHHCTCRSEKQVWTCLKFSTPMRKACCQSHSRWSSPSQGNPFHFSQKEKSSQEQDDDRKRMLLEDQKERKLSEAKSEVLKHECRAGLADSSIRELNRQVESQRKEIGHTVTGYEQCRRARRIGRTRTSTSWNSYQKYS